MQIYKITSVISHKTLGGHVHHSQGVNDVVRNLCTTTKYPNKAFTIIKVFFYGFLLNIMVDKTNVHTISTNGIYIHS